MSTSTFDYEFETRRRSVAYAVGWIGRFFALRRLLDVVDRRPLVVRYDPLRLELVEPGDEPTYAWCPCCRLNKRHDLTDASAMRVACKVCGDEHAFREAG